MDILNIKGSGKMYGTGASDFNAGQTCLNCRHWQPNVQIYCAAEGVICMLTKHTEPTDTCTQFSPAMAPDAFQDPNNYHEKYQKLTFHK